MQQIVLIALGGALGTLARFFMSAWTQRLTGAMFPLGTLGVNVLGCLLIGILAAAFHTYPVKTDYRFALTIGVLGGFTTFSSFGLETFYLARDGEPGLAFANVALNCVLGLAAVWIGFRVTEAWCGS